MAFLGIMIVYLFIASYPFNDGGIITEELITTKDGKVDYHIRQSNAI